MINPLLKPTKRRSLVRLDTKLKDLPRDWLLDYEPFLYRMEGTTCWLWSKGTDAKGYPVRSFRDPDTGVPRKEYVVKRVCEMFWDMPPGWYVEQTCGTRNCINPNHIVPTQFHPSQR